MENLNKDQRQAIFLSWLQYNKENGHAPCCGCDECEELKSVPVTDEILQKIYEDSPNYFWE